jgi:hypothetical protein
VRQDFFERIVELAPLVAGVGEQRLQERIHPEQGRKQQDAAVAILDVSGMKRSRSSGLGVLLIVFVATRV